MVWALSLAGCVPDPCSWDVECGPAALCWLGGCEPILERVWQVDVVAAEVGWSHPEGRAWDEDASPPDLYVELTTGPRSCSTGLVPESTAPVYDGGCPLFLSEHPRLWVTLWDDDGPSSELVARWRFDGRTPVVELALGGAGREVALVDETLTAFVWLTFTPR